MKLADAIYNLKTGTLFLMRHCSVFSFANLGLEIRLAFPNFSIPKHLTRLNTNFEKKLPNSVQPFSSNAYTARNALISYFA